MSWSADGRFLVYSKTVEGLDQVIVAATDGTSIRQITAGPEANWGPALSPDGRTVAFVKGYPNIIGLYAIQVDGSSERRLTRLPIDRFDLAEWSPDGSSLLYGAGKNDEGRADLWAVGLEGASERRIVGAPGNDTGPTWSPDGRWIAYLHTVPSGRTRVMVAAPDGSNPRQISEVGDWSSPYWSPDARNVLAVDGRVSGGGGPPIAVIFDPFGTSPASSFALPGLTGEGPPDFPAGNVAPPEHFKENAMRPIRHALRWPRSSSRSSRPCQPIAALAAGRVETGTFPIEEHYVDSGPSDACGFPVRSTRPASAGTRSGSMGAGNPSNVAPHITRTGTVTGNGVSLSDFDRDNMFIDLRTGAQMDAGIVFRVSTGSIHGIFDRGRLIFDAMAT